jgi:hypothetical protein
VTYHLGPIDPDRRTELFAEADEGEPQQRPRRVLRVGLSLLVMGLFSGGLWFAYIQGTHHAVGDAQNGNVPFIRADERPTKVKPDQPGGMEIPDRDKLIYNPSRKVVEHLLPPPETPMTRPVSPPPQSEAAPAPASPASGTPENPAAAQQTSQPQQQAAAPPGSPAATGSKAAQAPAGPPRPVNAKGAGARLQLGSLRSEEAARQEWERIKHKNADLLGSLSAVAVRADLGDKGVYYRIQTGPVADPAAAERICGELKQRNIGCIIAR